VPFKEKEEKHNNKEFMTVSSRGVIHFIIEWEREARLFQKIKKISFFENYRTWKTFSAWKTLMRRTHSQPRTLHPGLGTGQAPAGNPEADFQHVHDPDDHGTPADESGIRRGAAEPAGGHHAEPLFKEENRISLNENQEEEDNEEAEPFLVQEAREVHPAH